MSKLRLAAVFLHLVVAGAVEAEQGGDAAGTAFAGAGSSRFNHVGLHATLLDHSLRTGLARTIFPGGQEQVFVGQETHIEVRRLR